jgi:hypothetical protein
MRSLAPLLLALTALVVVAPPSHAVPFAHGSAHANSYTPADQSVLAPATEATQFRLDDTDLGYTESTPKEEYDPEMTVEVTTEKVMASDGTLADEFRVDAFRLARSPTDSRDFTGASSYSAGSWNTKPGTYYWQARAQGIYDPTPADDPNDYPPGTPDDESIDIFESRVITIIVRAPAPPPVEQSPVEPTPEPTPQPTPAAAPFENPVSPPPAVATPAPVAAAPRTTAVHVAGRSATGAITLEFDSPAGVGGRVVYGHDQNEDGRLVAGKDRFIRTTNATPGSRTGSYRVVIPRRKSPWPTGETIDFLLLITDAAGGTLSRTGTVEFSGRREPKCSKSVAQRATRGTRFARSLRRISSVAPASGTGVYVAGVAITDVWCGDFTGDGRAEMVAAYGCCTVSTQDPIAIFRRVKGRWRIAYSRLSIASFDTNAGVYWLERGQTPAVVIKVPVYESDDPNCCPSSFVYRSITFNGSRFVYGVLR